MDGNVVVAAGHDIVQWYVRLGTTVPVHCWRFPTVCAGDFLPLGSQHTGGQSGFGQHQADTR